MTSETKQARWAGQRQARGLCPRCGGATAGPNVYCEAHREWEHQRNVRRREYFRSRASQYRLTLRTGDLTMESR